MAVAIEKAIMLLKPFMEKKKESQKPIPFEEAVLRRLEIIGDILQAEEPSPASLGFSLKSKDYLLEFVNFCRQGEFYIG